MPLGFASRGADSCPNAKGVVYTSLGWSLGKFAELSLSGPTVRLMMPSKVLSNGALTAYGRGQFALPRAQILV
jgi:hypothetical protein